MHALNACPNVVEIRNIGVIAAIKLAPRRSAAGASGMEAHLKPFEKCIRATGYAIGLAPLPNVQKQDIDQPFGTVREVSRSVA